MTVEGCRQFVLGEVQAVICPPDQEILPRPVITADDLDQHPVVGAALVIEHQVKVAEYALSPEGTLRLVFRWMAKISVIAAIVLPPALVISMMLAAIAQALAVLVWSLVVAWVGLCVLRSLLVR